MKYVATTLSAALVLGLAGIASPALAGGPGGYGRGDCYKCPQPRPNYDSTEVIKNSGIATSIIFLRIRRILPVPVFSSVVWPSRAGHPSRS